MKLVIKFPRKLQAPAQTPTSEPHAAAEEAFAEDVDAAKVTSERKGQHKRASTSGQSEDDEGGKSTISTTSIRFKDKTTKASVKETPTINLSISLKGKKQQKQPRKRKLKDFNDVSEGDASAGGANVVINAGKRLKEGTKAPTAITTTTKIRFQFPASREKEKEDRTGSSEKKKSKKDKKEKKKGKKSSLKELIRNRELIKGVISEIEKLDYNEIFKYPVTEEIAPGYFSIVKEPMNTTKMTQKLENNLYTAWQVFWEDCVLMFRNAMQYNPDDSIYYMEAEKMLKDTAKLVSEASGGEVNVNESLLQSSGKRTTSGNGLHRKSQSNISGSIFSGGDQDQGKGLMGATSAVSSELLSIPVQQSRDSKNSVKHAIFRRHSFKLPQQSRIMGSLSNLSNGQGLPLINGATHLRMKSISIENYIQNLKNFCSILPKEAQSYIYKKTAERISPGITAKHKQQIQMQAKNQQKKKMLEEGNHSKEGEQNGDLKPSPSNSPPKEEQQQQKPESQPVKPDEKMTSA